MKKTILVNFTALFLLFCFDASAQLDSGLPVIEIDEKKSPELSDVTNSKDVKIVDLEPAGQVKDRAVTKKVGRILQKHEIDNLRQKVIENKQLSEEEIVDLEKTMEKFSGEGRAQESGDILDILTGSGSLGESLELKDRKIGDEIEKSVVKIKEEKVVDKTKELEKAKVLIKKKNIKKSVLVKDLVEKKSPDLDISGVLKSAKITALDVKKNKKSTSITRPHSLMFSKEEMDNIRRAVAAYNSGDIFEIEDDEISQDESQKDDLDEKKRQEELVKLNERSKIFLGSILYFSQDNWAIWLNNDKITSGQNKKGNEFFVKKINGKKVEILWLLSLSKWQILSGQSADDTDIKINNNNQVKIEFSLKPNQTFLLRYNKVIEGKNIASEVKRANETNPKKPQKKQAKKGNNSAKKLNLSDGEAEIFEKIMDETKGKNIDELKKEDVKKIMDKVMQDEIQGIAKKIKEAK